MVKWGSFIAPLFPKTNPRYYVIEVRENGKRSRIKKRGFRTQKEAKAAMRKR
ncbi:hypothetical protein DVH26_25450 [Paenibacillus sp. H1-7]|uniref:Arm DNA-binding domain-containing protein n=1 Tax=Paenibacillus sp. H1-7 TaxID=2282849 RepID=UPI001EF96693|nr:Arm DNA-binding domain-containing protein [Paenibacillus sp. H1-7]ULL17502.1 hypothetical protein DVH26_25450 [Paenibacillus sp. H1-7]